MTSLARPPLNTTPFPSLDTAIPSRSRSSTLDSLTRARNPSLSTTTTPTTRPSLQAHHRSTSSTDFLTKPNSQDASPPPSRGHLPRRSSSAMHREVLTRLRPLPFAHIWCVWHSKPAASTPSTTPPSSTSTSSTSSTTQSYTLTALEPQIPHIAAFYRIYNNTPWTLITPPSTMHIFREGVLPLWEDGQNVDGGCLVLKARGLEGAVRVWEEVCVLVLGGEVGGGGGGGGGKIESGDGEGKLDRAEEDGGQKEEVLGVSWSARGWGGVVSLWTRGNAGRGGNWGEGVVGKLSEELRPTRAEWYFKLHREHEGFEEAVKAREERDRVGKETRQADAGGLVSGEEVGSTTEEKAAPAELNV